MWVRVPPPGLNKHQQRKNSRMEINVDFYTNVDCAQKFVDDMCYKNFGSFVPNHGDHIVIFDGLENHVHTKVILQVIRRTIRHRDLRVDVEIELGLLNHFTMSAFEAFLQSRGLA